jgi:hypothetical protein
MIIAGNEDIIRLTKFRDADQSWMLERDKVLRPQIPKVGPRRLYGYPSRLVPSLGYYYLRSLR